MTTETYNGNAPAAGKGNPGGGLRSLKWQSVLPDICAIVLFLLLSFVYFYEPVTQDMVLGGHDSEASIGIGREQQEYRDTHDGETSRWTNAIFSGMPTYQTAPSYAATQFLGRLAGWYGLGTAGVVGYVFIMLLGFYILLRAFSLKPAVSALGALAWAFSSYFFIIIAAGHIWKFLTLAFIPPTIGGLVLCYRGRLLWGGAVTALFTAFQIQSNHAQMSYYFAFVMAFIVLAYGIDAIVRRKVPAYLKATGTVIVAGLLGLAANLPNLYHTYDYAKHTMRGGSELSAQNAGKGAGDSTGGGLERSYITQWSYGIDETLTLMIPNFKGGGSFEPMRDNSAAETNDEYTNDADIMAQQMGAYYPGWSQYWGEQPMTVGPVYAGAVICFLFVLGLFYVRGPLKWALLASTVVSLLFAWGHHINGLTDFFIDHLPLYNKFRTVSSALVIAEFTLPLLAMLCLARILREPALIRRRPVPFYASLALTAGVCFLFWAFPGLAGDCISGGENEGFNYLAQYFPAYRAAVTDVRHAILASSALRSLLLILFSASLLFLYARGALKGWLMCAALAVICLADMWQVNKRYLNTESFADPVVQKGSYEQKTQADEAILRDKGTYRVLNLTSGNPFNETSNRTAYWHKSIGGYHAAKLQRYQDLIDRCLFGEINKLGTGIAIASDSDMGMLVGDSICPVLNMLNAKYLIVPGNDHRPLAVCNTGALGNGWFVGKLSFVKGADAEMAALGKLDTRHAAVADEAFRSALDGSALGEGSVTLTSYAPNELHYDIRSPRGGVAVFSEVFYPGWTVTIDGRPAEAGRANYLLRALKVPAGNHEVVFEFRPASVRTTDAVAFGAIAVILALFAAALVSVLRKRHAQPRPEDNRPQD